MSYKGPSYDEAIDVCVKVLAERRRQDEKFGDQSGHTGVEWLAILAEEFGEVAKEAVEGHFAQRDNSNLKVELVQTAAVCVAWLEAIAKIETQVAAAAADTKA